jgi:hypothetical protein
MCLRRRILMNRTIDENSMFEMLDAAQVESRRRPNRKSEEPVKDDAINHKSWATIQVHSTDGRCSE